jgi:hypothetical protein
MNSMTESSNLRTIDVADGHVLHTCCGKLDDDGHRNFCENYRPGAGTPDYQNGFTQGYLSAAAQSVRLRKGFVELAQLREQLLACPDWCTDDHAGDDPADPVVNLILHQGDDHTEGTVSKLLGVDQDNGMKLDVRVSRTDVPQEGVIGVPSVYVQAELELTTWEQAAELARTILDAFGHLAGADRS